MQLKIKRWKKYKSKLMMMIVDTVSAKKELIKMLFNAKQKQKANKYCVKRDWET